LVLDEEIKEKLKMFTVIAEEVAAEEEAFWSAAAFMWCCEGKLQVPKVQEQGISTVRFDRFH